MELQGPAVEHVMYIYKSHDFLADDFQTYNIPQLNH